MQEDIRRYTVGFEVVSADYTKVVVRPYTEIDGDRVYTENITLWEGDSFETAYTKSVRFEDTINVGDRKWTSSREVKK